MNPGGSVKDRAGLAIITDAERTGALQPGGTVVEGTAGNTGIGLALICAIRGLRLILTLPESMSLERRKLLTGYGAELVLTPREKGLSKRSDSAGFTPGPRSETSRISLPPSACSETSICAWPFALTP